MISLSQIVAALSVTYDDAGVAIWLGSRNRGLGGAAPIDVIARDPLDGIERVADLVRAIGDADPNSSGEERPEDTVRRYLSGCPDRCDRCHRPLPHSEAESRVCSPDVPAAHGRTA